MSYKSMSFFFTLLLLLATNGAVYANTLQDLYERPDRPTMLEVLPLLDKIKEEEGVPMTAVEAAAQFKYDERMDIHAWLEILLESTPRLIAIAEKLHPNATWVFLGRDSLAISDVFEAYYHTIGQKNRVVRLGVSKGTFASRENPEASDPLEWGPSVRSFFESEGFRWEASGKEGPYIIIDPISSGYGRQGRSILASMYASGLREGHNILSMVDRLNMLGLMVSTFSYSQVYDVSIAAKQLQREKWVWLLSNKLNYQQLFDYKSIVTYMAASNKANEAGYTHFIGAWHDSFGPFIKGRNGVRARPGPAYPVAMKKSVLWTQKKIWEAMDERQFVHKVQHETRRLDSRIEGGSKTSAKAAKQIDALIKRKSKLYDPYADIKGWAQSFANFQEDQLKEKLFHVLNNSPPSVQVFQQLQELLVSNPGGDGRAMRAAMRAHQAQTAQAFPGAPPIQPPVPLNNTNFYEVFTQVLEEANNARKKEVKEDSTLEILIRIHEIFSNSSCDDILETF